MSREIPRRSRRPLENPGEPKLLVVLLIDTSGSMAHVADQLTEGCKTFVESLSDHAKGRVEVALITFDDDARLTLPAGSIYDFELPRFDCGGMTAMHSAIEFAMRIAEERVNFYREERNPHYKPWIALFSDGKPNDRDNGSFNGLINAQKARKISFYCVGIGNDIDESLLKSLSLNGLSLKASKEDFIGAFEYLSSSISKVSEPEPGTAVPLDNPTPYQLTVIS